MTNIIGRNSKDYIKSQNKTDLEKCDYIDEVLQNIRIILTAKRGRFYPNKDFGSLLNKLDNAPKNEYAVQYAAQALDGLDGVFVKSARVSDTAVTINLTINGNERQVTLELENNL